MIGAYIMCLRTRHYLVVGIGNTHPECDTTCTLLWKQRKAPEYRCTRVSTEVTRVQPSKTHVLVVKAVTYFTCLTAKGMRY